MKNILVIPNITFKKDLSKDSFVKVMKNIVKNLNETRSDLNFLIPVTEKTKELEFENVYQFVIDLPSYPNSMRGHFDSHFWKKIINWKNLTIDLVYSHLPEQTNQVLNLISNVTNIGKVNAIGYCHWTETKEFANYDETYLHYNIYGVSKMISCGYNTQTQIDNIINEVKDFYSESTIQSLHKIMRPVYLGIEGSEIRKPNEDYEKIIVFNHRLNSYRRFNFFKEVIEELREHRQDFKVWASFSDVENEYWIKKDLPKTKDYYDYLSKCCVGVLCGNRWAVSVQDGLINGLPYIYEDGSETRELFGKIDTNFSTKEELLSLLNKFLDDKDYRMQQSNEAIKEAKKMKWSNRIKPISNQIDEALSLNKPIGEKSQKREEILEFVKKRGIVSKSEILKHFNWGVGIKFLNYRTYLLENGVKSTIQTDMFGDNCTEYYSIKK